MSKIYDNFAKEFDKSRYKIWNQVKLFLDDVKEESINLDLGCGNGKNMLYNPKLNFIGLDISLELVNICKSKKLNAIEGSVLDLPFENNYFDNIICIAVYHHLDNDIDRQKALSEMYRVLKINGKILLSVWSMEQPDKGPGSQFKFSKADEMVPWKSKSGEVFLRYYHIYETGSLEEEIRRLEPRFKIHNIIYELGNWYITLSK
jgi:ubiquinone/menaquinone biosynthesis C-methylase UbiE